MALQWHPISPETQSPLWKLAEDMRGLLSGPAGCPEWGTKCCEIEQTGMCVVLKRVRLLMKQRGTTQVQAIPDVAFTVQEDEVRLAGTAFSVF